MQHLDDGVLHALVDGEIPSTELPPIQEHLGSCASCAARLEEARLLAGESESLVELIDLPERTAPALPAGPAIRRGGGGRLGRRLAWAATVVLAAGLGYAGGRRGAGVIPAPTQVALAPATVSAPEADNSAVQSARDAAEPAVGPAEKRAAVNQPVAVKEAAPETPVSQLAAAPETAPAEAERTTGRSDEQLADRSRRAVEGGVAAPAPAPAAMAARPLGDEKANESKLAFRREAAEMARQPAATDPFEEVTLSEAVRRLGGTLRLVEGLVPQRLEAAGPVVRVVYGVTGGTLILEQQRQGDSVAVRLVAPGLSPDSLARVRIRE